MQRQQTNNQNNNKPKNITEPNSATYLGVVNHQDRVLTFKRLVDRVNNRVHRTAVGSEEIGGDDGGDRWELNGR